MKKAPYVVAYSGGEQLVDAIIDLSVMWDGSVEVKDTSLVFGDVEVKLRHEQLESLRKALEVK